MIRGLPSYRNFIGSHYEDVIRGDDGNTIVVETFSVIVDAQVTHEDDRQMSFLPRREIRFGTLPP